MKKITIFLSLTALLLSGPALAQPLRQKPRKAQIGYYLAPGVINRTASSKRDVSLPSEQAQHQSMPFLKASSDSSPGSVQDKCPVFQPPRDRPFDGGASAVNPFAPPDPSPGSLSSPAVSLESEANPFRPAGSMANPFQGTRSDAEPFSPKGPGFLAPVARSSPDGSRNGVPNIRTTINTADTQPNPWSRSGENNARPLLNPIGLPWDIYPRGAQGNPYSLEDLFPGRLPTLQRSP
jgi:hypothetical protein